MTTTQKGPTTGGENVTHIYRVRKWLPERYGQRCRLLARGSGPGPRNLLIEFGDGRRVVAPRWSIRKLPPTTDH